MICQILRLRRIEAYETTNKAISIRAIDLNFKYNMDEPYVDVFQGYTAHRDAHVITLRHLDFKP